MSWAEIKKAVNDNLDYPLNKQEKILRQLAFTDASALSWTVPHTGKYVVTCIGKGGNGGNGRYSSSQAEYYNGGGGGSGAIAKSLLDLTADDVISITANSAVSSFGSYLSATAGSNGTNASTSISAGGIGGTAAGGTIINLDGITGYASNGTIRAGGASTPLQTPLAVSRTPQGNNSGGAGYNPLSFPSRGAEKLNVTDPAKAEFCGGGAGGGADGGSGFGGGGGGGAGISGGTSGATGGAGAVIIEYFEEVFG